MKKNIFFINIKEKILILFLAIFSILINQYYGNKGVFPVDSFAHFDTGFRILLGEYPFKDYWVVSGPFVDYLQGIFFYFLGVSWQSYLFHASLFNSILVISTFSILRTFDLNVYYSFLYSLLLAILAYPTSGTPFVDHHSSFFSLLGIYSLILGIKYEKKVYWYLLPFLLGFAFFSKQVPASYVILSIFFILIYYSLSQNKYYWIKYFLFSSLLFLLSLFFLGKFHEISFYLFLEQYIFYPQIISQNRFESLNLTFNGLINHFKFIYLAAIPLFYVNIKMLLESKNYFKHKDFCYFLIVILFTFSLIFHQILTKNQTFIFFLIPILFSFSNISLNKLKFNFNNILQILLILTCLAITLKYHSRFNENRKFHELSNINFSLTSNANQLDEKFKGLKWITPEYKNNPKQEIALLNKVKQHLLNEDRNKMIMTNYSFFSAILDKKLFSPSRWYLSDGTAYPVEKNKYFNSYKNLIIKHIKNNNIEVIYTIYPLDNSVIYTYLDESCFIETKISKILISYELKSCDAISD